MSRSKADKEREKILQERCQILLTTLLKEEDNKYCVDCDSKGPRWASWNLGIFLCIRCAGIHRNLGVHISKVRSVNLDSWTPLQVSSMQCMGNSRGRAVYEASVPDDFKRPTSDSGLEQYIRAKYEKKKYIMKDWVATKPPDLPEGWNLLIEQEKLGKHRDPKMAVLGSSSNNLKASESDNRKPESTSLSVGKSNSIIPAKTSPAARTAAARPTTGVTSSASCSAVDLLGLSSKTSSCQDDDLFSNFVSAPPAVTSTNSVLSSEEVCVSSVHSSANKSTLEEDFFNQVSTAPSAGLPGTANHGASTDPSKMSNSSIMALFSSIPQNKGPNMVASPAAPQTMTGYPPPSQTSQHQKTLYPGQQQHQAIQQQNYIQPSSSPFFNNNLSIGLDPLAALGGFGGGQKGLSSSQPGQGLLQMNNQFSGLNVNGSVELQSQTNLMSNTNQNQLNAANITGLYNMVGNMGSPAGAGHNLTGVQSAPNLFSSPGQNGSGAGIFSGSGVASGQIPGSGQPNQQHTPSFASWN